MLNNAYAQSHYEIQKGLQTHEKQGKDMTLLEDVIEELLAEKFLDKKYLDYPLSDNYVGFMECHIQPDWLLIYTVDHQQLILVAARTGSHSDLLDL